MLGLGQAASHLYNMAWGREWQDMSEGIIVEGDIDDDKTDSADDDEDSYLADKLRLDTPFRYTYFEKFSFLRRALGDENSAQEEALVVREEYDALNSALESDFAEVKAVVVTGQPGIGSYESWFSSQSNADRYLGKTTFLLFLLLRRLEKELPTAIQLDDQYYFVFDQQGAGVFPLMERSRRLRECWALVDSNNNVGQPCLVFQHLAKRVIQTSSPKPERYKEWIKQKRGKIIISDLPSVLEIAAIV